jgi:hypothetical protein
VAFGLRRWLIAALASCALVGVAFLPPDWEWSSSVRFFYYRGHEGYLEDVLRVHRSRLQQLELRDSLLALAGEGFSEGEPILLVQEGMPRVVVDALRARAEMPFNVVRDSAPEIRTVLAITAHELPIPWSGPGTFSRLNFFFPVATDGKTCLVALALESDAPEANRLRSIEAAANNYAILGPCAYYAAFGRPGSHIEEWLELANFYPALLPAWAVDVEPLGLLSPEQLRRVSRGRGELYACAAGNRHACRSGISDPMRRGFYFQLYPVYRRERGILGAGSSWLYSTRMGPNLGRLLSDLMLDMGEERFARFWSSEASLEAAFAESFDVELEDWVMSWARVQVGRVERPGPEPSSALLGLLLAAVFVGGATFVLRIRQVT